MSNYRPSTNQPHQNTNMTRSETPPNSPCDRSQGAEKALGEGWIHPAGLPACPSSASTFNYIAAGCIDPGQPDPNLLRKPGGEGTESAVAAHLLGALSIEEFGKRYGVCRTTTNKLIKSGELETKLVGRRELYPNLGDDGLRRAAYRGGWKPA